MNEIFRKVVQILRIAFWRPQSETIFIKVGLHLCVCSVAHSAAVINAEHRNQAEQQVEKLSAITKSPSSVMEICSPQVSITDTSSTMHCNSLL